MKLRAQMQMNRQCRLVLALVCLLHLAPLSASAQGTIIYDRFPPTVVPPPATSFPEDAEGTRLFPGPTNPSTYPLSFNGQLVCTFSAAQNGFAVVPSSSLTRPRMHAECNRPFSAIVVVTLDCSRISDAVRRKAGHTLTVRWRRLQPPGTESEH